MSDFETLIAAGDKALDEMEYLNKAIPWFQAARDSLWQRCLMVAAQRFIGSPYDEQDSDRLRVTIEDCDRLIEVLKAKREAVRDFSWGWIKLAQITPGPVEEKEKLSQIIAGIETCRESSIPPLSPDQCLDVLKHVSTDMERDLIDKVLTLLEHHGPLVTDQVLDRVPQRSETAVKAMLSRLRKIRVIVSGPGGYGRPPKSKDQSKD
jgi:hypothetical protein